MHNKFPSALCELPYDPLDLIFLIEKGRKSECLLIT